MSNQMKKILEINVQKSNFNKTVTDVSIGDKVRKSLTKQNHSFVKGTDPRWSDKVFVVSAVRGQTISLNDGTTIKRLDLLKVPANTLSSEPNAIHLEKRIYKS